MLSFRFSKRTFGTLLSAAFVSIQSLGSVAAHAALSGMEPVSAAAMVEYLDAMAAEIEDQNDVKCWTSFGDLETFVAGAQLSPTATHLKTELVMNYLDQVWKRASASVGKGQAVDAASFDQVASQAFPSEESGIMDYRVGFGTQSVSIPYQDVTNYLATVEPTRLLRTLAQRVAVRDAQRPPLSGEAIDSAIELSALLSAAVLKESNV